MCMCCYTDAVYATCNIHHNSQVERSASPGNIMAYIQAAQRGVWFLDRETSDPVYEMFKSWMRDYSTKCESQRGYQSWEDLSSCSKWLHWEEVIEIVKIQKEAYESTPPGIHQERESLQYTLLFLPSPPGRPQEYRTLSFKMRITAPTPHDPLSNVLFITNDVCRAALHIGRYKTSNSKVISHLYILTKHRPLLLQLTAAWEGEHNYIFVVRHTHTHTHTPQALSPHTHTPQALSPPIR